MLAVVTASALAGWACDGQSPSVEWAPGLSAAAQDTLLRWLLCDDCDPALRTNAATLQDRAVTPLRDALAGPPESWRNATRERAARVATRIGRTGSDSAAMVADELERFDASVQRRGALLLGDVGTPPALAVLREAIDAAEARGYRADVVRTLHEALVTASVDPFGGRLSDTTPRFLDTVRIVRDPAVEWNGDEAVVLHGAPFPDALVVRRWDLDSLAFVAAGETGRYTLSIVNIGVGQEAFRAPLEIRAFPAPAAGVRDVSAAELPLTVLRSLSRTATIVDTVHAYRFRPAEGLSVTATVEWKGPAEIELSWRDCVGASVPGVPGRVSGTVVDATGAPLGGAQITAQGTALATTALAGGEFTLIGVPPAWEGTLRSTRIGYQPVDAPAREGRAGYWITMVPPAEAAPAPVAEQTSSGPSPRTETTSLAAGSCRLLTLSKRDSAVYGVIARLRLESP